MAKQRRRSGGKRRAGGAGLRVASYLGVAALGAVVALAATGRLPAPQWPRELASGLERTMKPERPVKPERPRATPAKPDRTIETAAIPVPRPQRLVPERKAAAAPVPLPAAAARPPGGIAPKPKSVIPEAPKPPAVLPPASVQPASLPAAPGKVTRVSGVSFPVCGDAPSRGCVIDGDTFVLDGKAIRVAGIEVPESGSPECAREAALADRARQRLKQLLNAGPVELVAGSEDRDVYGRKQRAVLRDGRPLAETLIAEGLARPASAARKGWCR